MEYRKLIKFGNSSFVISLPKEWVRKHNVKKGDMVFFEENEKSELVLSPSNIEDIDDKKIIKLNIDGMSDKEIEREIIANYIKEFSRIIITGNEVASRYKEIRGMLHNLVAIEVIEQSNERIIAKDFLNVKEIELNDLRKRLDIVVRGMLTDSKLGENKKNYENINNRDSDANRFAYVLFRVIRRGIKKSAVRKTIGMSSIGLVHELHTILTMERIADIAKRISREDYKGNLTKEEMVGLNAIYSVIIDNYNDAIKSYRLKDYKLSCEVFSRNKKVITLCDDIKLNLKTAPSSKILHLLRELSTNVSIMGEIGMMNADTTISKISYEQNSEQ
ncbi:MAG: AbrB/MazE/SpoVT family DNA-binding domain-containing protein [Nanoarchaeota archaeon]|nr:AbrB/MazE/SpoVT family DNA-binding domain-containing protein [Nanoarchaeota archaeon]